MLPYPTRTDRVGLAYLQYYAPHRVFHCGVDFNYGSDPNADFGQDVISPTWSVVEYVSPIGTNGGLGNYLVLHHPYHGVWTRYLHLETIHVATAQKVSPGQLIAALGDSGTSLAHLHVEVLNEKGHAFIRDWKRPYGRYPSGLPKQTVASMFLDPVLWLRESQQPDVLSRDELMQKLENAQRALPRASESRKPKLIRLIERITRLLRGDA